MKKHSFLIRIIVLCMIMSFFSYGAWFYVVNGRLATEFSGEVEYDGATFTVVNGQVQTEA